MKAEIKPATITYIEDFLPRGEADALFEFVKSLAPVRPLNPRNQRSFIRKLSYGCYSVLPESRTGMTVHGGGSGWLSTAPDQIKKVAASITEYAKIEINYLSLLGYAASKDAKESDHIGFHRHREDDTLIDQTVYVLTCGHDNRALTLRPIGSKDRSEWSQLNPAHGSLYVLPHAYNQTHEHAVLDSKVPCGLRISINCKHIDPAYILSHQPDPEPEPFVRDPGPPRIYCKRKDRQYPADAVSVTKGTPYGNYKGLKGREWIEEVMRLMKDPAFAAEVEKLRGRDLLCWCDQIDPDCHAYAWLTLANGEKP